MEEKSLRNTVLKREMDHCIGFHKQGKHLWKDPLQPKG